MIQFSLFFLIPFSDKRFVGCQYRDGFQVTPLIELLPFK